ncbi:hypothetical protein COO60DRAFT_1673271 [Scenedesmus sp. NREL 46B-D3]|nr:hypothetical protein COO60DRAFT_1673271 [Scenedesmus sp. NREL 46B-D3]
MPSFLSSFSCCLCLLLCLLLAIWAKLVLLPWTTSNKGKVPSIEEIVSATREVLDSPSATAADAEQSAVLEGSFAQATQQQPQQQQPQQQQQQPQQPPSPKKTAAEKAVNFLDKNKGKIIGTGIQLLAPSAIGAIVKRAAPRAARQAAGRASAKLAARANLFVAKTAVKVLNKLGVKLGQKALARFGLMAANKLAIGTAAGGPVGAAVVAVQLAVEAAFMALDFADAGGYLKMGTKVQYLKLRKEVESQLRQSYQESELPYPSIAGPFDKLPPEDSSQRISALYSQILEDPEHPVMKPVVGAAVAHVQARLPSASPQEFEDAVAAYLADRLPEDAAWEAAFASTCSKLGGRVEGKDLCGWGSKQACDSSYTWPLKEEDASTYVEWRNGRCEVAPSSMRATCDANQLPYDAEAGICKIDAAYCKKKGADWLWDKDIGDYDCKVNTAQDIFESIFGSTIVRGLKQIFDPAQFEKCAAGEFDDVYTCRKVTCPANKPEADKVTGLCYQPCPEGWHKRGCCLCEQDCPAGYTDRGATCDKKGCPADKQDNQGGLCYAACRPGFVGNGPVCWEQCKPGEVNDGATCRVPNETYGNGVGTAKVKTPCPAGMRDDGTSCYVDTVTAASRLPSKAPCAAGERDDGTSCWAPLRTRTEWYDRFSWGCGTHVKRCHDGSLGKCKTDCYKTRLPRTVTTGGTITQNVGQRYRCNAGEDLIASVCYAKCPAGFQRRGLLCEPDGGPGIRVALDKRLHCPAGTTDIAGLCYKDCPAGWQFQGGSVCHKVGTGAVRGKASHGRGAGVPDIHTVTKAVPKGAGTGSLPLGTSVRGKKRIIPFSSKSN